MFLFERILDRLAGSPYRNQLILKGGLLISSMAGISERTTMDMDTTVQGIDMTEDEITRVVQDILNVDVHDGFRFVFKKIEPIREDDDYRNFRITLEAEYGKIKAPMKIDITTGDIITPSSVRYDYPSLFEDRYIPVMAYTLETIIAEKYETMIRRNIGTTRIRDLYDLYLLFHLFKDRIQIPVLKKAVEQTSEKRGSREMLNNWEMIITHIRSEPELHRLWNIYSSENSYAAKITFHDAVDAMMAVAELIR